MNKESIIKFLEDFFERDGDRFRVQNAFLYGSFAGEHSRGDSDIDVAIVFEEDACEDELFGRLVSISLSLSEGIGLEVNVIPIYRDFRKPLLYYNAIVMGLPLYLKNPSGYANLKNEAIYHMEDFGMFGLKWQMTLARKNLEALKYA